LSKLSLRRAVGHVAKYGDTDVLPHPVESVFLSERKTKIVDELAMAKTQAAKIESA